ncbi:cytochrome o ubiquinol oxidase subunit I [uncultured Shewanella sp.]|uniref:cytochrome o ubiquinol oxidase subunit I n=1 Tax=uncultured Shewanella sp. TaxID=173975 RepID=UPI00261B4AE5|nr:cytochrome o ubiquinol oxidase subunit I [uncultured Shewanella sp.]
MFGKLTWDAIPWHNPLPLVASVMMILVVLYIGYRIQKADKWRYLWDEWITSVDHKKIGIMYILVAFVMMLRGFSDAIMMRLQLAIASGNEGYLPPEHYDQIFTAHGVIMIFFVAMPLVIGLINIVVPQQIGARDVAFPFMNSLSFWLFVAGMALVNISLGIGEFATTGWLAYPPLSELSGSPGVGVDYYIWSLQISGIGTLLTGINFLVTIFKMRCPGMKLMRMPIFTWTALFTNILIIAAFPVLTVTLALLALDRYLGTHFFTATGGGDQMMYVNLIWIWGHPEVYILILPAFGVFSEVVSTFARKRLFGYTSMVYASGVISILAFSVWLHHFFTMGAGANVNAFFGIATMIISIPTGVKIFNWLFTIYRGRLKMNLPIMWTLAFLSTFTVGGMTGVLLAVPGADFLLHNSLFLIAHFHNVIIGGVVFGMFAGYSYWFPKAFGFKLEEKKWGKRAFWFWVVGFYFAFIPLYALGFMGMTRRLSHYDPSTGWQPLLLVALSGAVMVMLGIACQVVQLYVSIRDRKENLDVTGDAWDGRTLEWQTSSPPAHYNFAFTPVVGSRDSFWEDKQKNGGKLPKETRPYVDIHMPRNTSAGFIISAFSLVFGFAMIWHIWWLAGVSVIGMFISFVCRCFDTDVDYYVPAAEVEATEKLRAQNV